MYADTITRSMQETIDATNYRREKQFRYNEENGITPAAIIKKRTTTFLGEDEKNKEKLVSFGYSGPEDQNVDIAADPVLSYMTTEKLEKAIEQTKKEMQKAAKELDFIQAAQYRDEMFRLEKLLKGKTSK
jgi:excinuclease ABC subunit B